MEKNSSDSETDVSIYLPPTSEPSTPNWTTKSMKIEDRPNVEDVSLTDRVGSPCSGYRDLMEEMVTLSPNSIQNSQESEISVDYNRISLSQDYFADESCSEDNINNNITGQAQHKISEIDWAPSPDKSDLLLDSDDSVFNDPEYLYLTSLPPPVSPIPMDVNEIDGRPSNPIKLFPPSYKNSSYLDSKSEIQPSNNLPQKISASGSLDSKREDKNKSQFNSDFPKITSEVPKDRVNSSSRDSVSSFGSDLSLVEHPILLPHITQKNSNFPKITSELPKVRGNFSSKDSVSSFESDLSLVEHPILLPHITQKNSNFPQITSEVKGNSSSKDSVSSFGSDLSLVEHPILLPHITQKNSNFSKITSEVPKMRSNSSSRDSVSSFGSDLSLVEHPILLPHITQKNSNFSKITSELPKLRSNSSSKDSVSSFESDLSLVEHPILLSHITQNNSSSLASGSSNKGKQVNSKEYRNFQEFFLHSQPSGDRYLSQNQRLSDRNIMPNQISSETSNTNRKNKDKNYTIINFYSNTDYDNKSLSKSRRGRSDQSRSFSIKKTWGRNKNSRKPFQTFRIQGKLKNSQIFKYIKDIVDNQHLSEKIELISFRSFSSGSEETTTDTD